MKTNKYTEVYIGEGIFWRVYLNANELFEMMILRALQGREGPKVAAGANGPDAVVGRQT